MIKDSYLIGLGWIVFRFIFSPFCRDLAYFVFLMLFVCCSSVRGFVEFYGPWKSDTLKKEQELETSLQPFSCKSTFCSVWHESDKSFAFMHICKYWFTFLWQQSTLLQFHCIFFMMLKIPVSLCMLTVWQVVRTKANLLLCTFSFNLYYE